MRVLRAFLSHSSTQKEFVEAVARELGRQYCVFDKYSFHTGDDLHEAIKRGLNDSSLFVLFASKEALRSCGSTSRSMKPRGSQSRSS